MPKPIVGCTTPASTSRTSERPARGAPATTFACDDDQSPYAIPTAHSVGLGHRGRHAGRDQARRRAALTQPRRARRGDPLRHGPGRGSAHAVRRQGGPAPRGPRSPLRSRQGRTPLRARRGCDLDRRIDRDRDRVGLPAHRPRPAGGNAVVHVCGAAGGDRDRRDALIRLPSGRPPSRKRRPERQRAALHARPGRLGGRTGRPVARSSRLSERGLDRGPVRRGPGPVLGCPA